MTDPRVNPGHGMEVASATPARSMGGEVAPSLTPRAQVLLWAAQRISAAVLGVCVLVHLVTIVYAVRGGLTAAEILARTSGSVVWGGFYALFVAAVAVHAPIGLRTVLTETFGWRGRSLEIAMLLLAIALAASGARAVYAVVGA